jgi:thymidylate synthase
MIATMRSQDAWWGFVYDTGEFQWFQEIMAGWLGVELGRYIHFDGSLHLYERDWLKAREVADQDFNFSLYDKVEVMDARLDRENYSEMEELLANWERACRTGTWRDEFHEASFESDFYFNLMDIILAYNLRLKGEKKEAYEIVRKNKSDLGLIYESRWRKDGAEG